MAHKDVSGVSGVLGSLISESTAKPAAPPAEASGSASFSPKPVSSGPNRKPKPLATRSRLGRPPGKKASRGQPKEKITLRIDAELIAAYRDWSWDARCQVGELVEQALRSYLGRRNPR